MTVVKTAADFVDLLLDDIAKNRLEIPTLPEVALRVRKLIQDPNVTNVRLAKAIGTDPALTSRLLQVANSAMFTGMKRVDNIQAAVGRLGHSLVRNMVTCVVMKAIYQPRINPNVAAMMKTLWRHSTHVAALCHVIARKYPHLKPDEAMLAGLIHDIGHLPVLTRAARFPAVANDPEKLALITAKLHGEIGRLILKAWNFQDEIVAVAAGHEDLNRIQLGDVDYVDIVQVANLHSYVGTDHRLAKLNWSDIPVFDRLQLSPEDSIAAVKDAKVQVQEVYRLLSG